MASGEPCHVFRCRHKYVGCNGEQRCFDLLAYRPGDGMPLRWNLGRFLEAHGYERTANKSTSVASRYKDQVRLWDTWGEDLAVVNPSLHRAPSRTSARAHARLGVDAVETADDDFWLSTLYLLMVSMRYSTWRKRDHARSHSSDFLSEFLALTLGVDELRERLPLHYIDPDALRLCSAGVEDGACQHVRVFRLNTQDAGNPPQRVLAGALSQFGGECPCDALQSHLVHVLHSTVELIDTNTDRWGTSDLLDKSFSDLKTCDGTKRRRIPLQVKEALLVKGSEGNMCGASTVGANFGIADTKLASSGKWQTSLAGALRASL